MEIEKLSAASVKKLLADAPKEGIAKVILKDPKRTGSVTIRDYFLEGEDGSNTHRPFVDSNGNPRIVKITKNKTLHLERENDRLEYMQIKLHPIYTTGATPILELVNKEEESIDYIATKDLESKVNGIIQKLEGDKLRNFARVLMVKFNEGSSDSTVKRAVYELAEEDPQRVLAEWEDPERPMKELIRVGLIKGIVSKKNGRWSVNGTITGTSFEQTLSYLSENEDLVPGLRKQIFK